MNSNGIKNFINDNIINNLNIDNIKNFMDDDNIENFMNNDDIEKYYDYFDRLTYIGDGFKKDKNDNINGYGLVRYDDGTIYIGSIRNGERNGKGVLKDKYDYLYVH